MSWVGVRKYRLLSRLVLAKLEIPEEHADWIRGRQISVYKRLLPFSLIASALNCLTILILCGTPQNAPGIWLWALIMTALALGGLPAGRRALRSDKAIHPRKERAVSKAAQSALLLGIGWGLLPVFVMETASSSQQMAIATVCAGMMCGGAFILSTMPRAAVNFAAPIAAGFAFSLLSQGISQNWALALLALTYCVTIVRTTYWTYANYVQNWLQQIELKQKNEVISLLLKDFEDTTSDCLWELDASGRVINASAALAMRLGRSSQELNGEMFTGLFDNAELNRDNSGVAELIGAMEERAAFRDIIVPVQIDGAVHWWALAGKPAQANGKPSGYRGVASDVTSARNAEARISYLAHFDPLTDVPNREQFREELEGAFLLQKESGQSFAVFCLDLDFFKTINDVHGHPVGDAVLRTAAQRMRECVGPNDVVARFGGDEFAILLRKIDDHAEALEIANELIASMALPVTANGLTVQTGISVGVAACPDHGDAPDDLLKNADLALYRAKKAGRGQAYLFEAAMDIEVRNRRELEVALRKALGSEEICLFYQPLVDATSRKTVAFEALARWRHPEKGYVSPDHFVPLAEETGLVNTLGEWIIREAFAEAATWADEVSISINLSPIQVKNPGLISTLVNAMAQTGLRAERVELEITESVLLDCSEDSMRMLHAMRDLGFKISLDDFGTGYSSLSYLRNFPFDKIKIDRSFLEEIDSSTECRSIVKSIVELAKNLGMRTTAEGVETKAQAEAVVAEGCDQLQGYFFSPPRTAEELAASGLINKISRDGQTELHSPANDEAALPDELAERKSA